ncbi:MAG: hypothetical protein ACUZ9M_00810 [Candidatus Scalindua sp.]
MVVSILTAVAVSVVVAVMGLIGRAVNDWTKQEKAKGVRHEAIDALSMGVDTIRVEVVEGLKAAAKDGKLSKSEIKTVQEKAILKAMDIASDPKVIDFLLNTAIKTISAIITSIVQGGKKDAKS